MNKTLKIFIKVIYYVFTFGLGILLAFTLPGLLVTANLPKHVEEYLTQGEYRKSVNLLVCYNETEVAFHKEYEDGSGLVLFRALIIDEESVDGKTVEYARLSYSGFLYGTGGNYPTELAVNNKTKLIVNKGLEGESTVQLLNYDADEDGIYDNVLSMIECKFVFFDIPKETADTISSLTFVDCDGAVYVSQDVGELSFTNSFFKDLEQFVEIYNLNSKDERLQSLEDEFLAKSQTYEKCSYQGETKRANKEGAIFIVAYFVVIYILGDFLVGHHFILRFFIWLINKIRGKKEDKVKEESSPEGVYGTDYYTQLTMKCIVPEDCEINVTVNYHNETNEIEMVLSKDKDYTVAQRVHAGTYVNAWVEAPGYVTLNLPKTLEVRGYRMTVEVTLRKEDSKA